MKCPKCGSDVWCHGPVKRKVDGATIRRYTCKKSECGYKFRDVGHIAPLCVASREMYFSEDNDSKNSNE